jgi:hypothetical protein
MHHQKLLLEDVHVLQVRTVCRTRHHNPGRQLMILPHKFVQQTQRISTTVGDGAPSFENYGVAEIVIFFTTSYDIIFW